MNGLQLPLDIPDLWQQDAVRALRSGHDVVVDAPTGAGKTRIFELFVEGRRQGQAVYTVPTRALANDKWTEWKTRGWDVGIATGDIAENLHAPVVVATLETQRERILADRAPSLLVIDEYQMIADSRRGLNYELAIALPSASTQLLLLSGSVRNPAEIVAWLKKLGRTATLIQIKERPVPLDEFPIEQLPRVPHQIQGFWQRLGAGVVVAGLSPLLIFAPRRADAERIAKKVAEALPMDNPIPVDPAYEKFLGRDLVRLLQHRVAYHHSGLSYAARAGWIEPLAKNGHLHIIVATTGLAAGINFSVRSVLVSDTSYQDGPFSRELRPDELLQMFGRAGRRGLDESGHVLVAQNSPRLLDAHPRQLHRVNQMDWPTLLRIMEGEAARGGDVYGKAAEVCERLFSRQTIRIGFESHSEASDAPSHYGPTRAEFLNSKNEWQNARGTSPGKHPAADCLVLRQERWTPALRSPQFVESLGIGRLCKIRGERSFHYGKEVAVGHFVTGNTIRPIAWVSKQLHLRKDDVFSEEDFWHSVVPLLPPSLKGATPQSLVKRGNSAAVILEVGAMPVLATRDEHHQLLIDPPRRRVSVQVETGYAHAEGRRINPPPGSAARAWRTLGLVNDEGHPTARGRVFSRFQAGEGLMIAAALEDKAYPLEELVNHLANLRGGPRFSELAGGGSERLAIASREIYGHVDYEGYLITGLSEGYGEGTWEAIETFLSSGMRGFTDVPVSLGDIERAILEWQSLLRHVIHAPPADTGRWEDFQNAAAAALREPKGKHTVDWANHLPLAYRQPRRTEKFIRLERR